MCYDYDVMMFGNVVCEWLEFYDLEIRGEVFRLFLKG